MAFSLDRKSIYLGVVSVAKLPFFNTPKAYYEGDVLEEHLRLSLFMIENLIAHDIKFRCDDYAIKPIAVNDRVPFISDYVNLEPFLIFFDYPEVLSDKDVTSVLELVNNMSKEDISLLKNRLEERTYLQKIQNIFSATNTVLPPFKEQAYTFQLIVPKI